MAYKNPHDPNLCRFGPFVSKHVMLVLKAVVHLRNSKTGGHLSYAEVLYEWAEQHEGVLDQLPAEVLAELRAEVEKMGGPQPRSVQRAKRAKRRAA